MTLDQLEWCIEKHNHRVCNVFALLELMYSWQEKDAGNMIMYEMTTRSVMAFQQPANNEIPCRISADQEIEDGDEFDFSAWASFIPVIATCLYVAI